MCEHLLEFSLTSSWRKQEKGATMFLFVIHLKEFLRLSFSGVFFLTNSTNSIYLCLEKLPPKKS